MISVTEADQLIIGHCGSGSSESVALLETPGRVLHQEIRADRPFPPFDRVMMDGVAVSRAVLNSGLRAFSIAGSSAAGSPRETLRDSRSCMEVMTGAVCPEGADLIVPVEYLERSGGEVKLSSGFTPPDNGFIHRCGSDFAEGEILVQPGLVIDGRVVAVAASSGCTDLIVSALPRVAVVSTGDELVEVAETPLPHQLRRSNVHAMRAVLSKVARVEEVHLEDRRETVERGLSELLERNDFVVLSGGVSAGKFDFVPVALSALGVEKHFHKVAQRPGKPMWFGTYHDRTMVFGLPGNPVSTYVGLHRYVLPAVDLWRKRTPLPLRMVGLAVPYRFQPELTCFLPVRINSKGQAVPAPVANSGDFAHLLESDGFVELPSDRSEFEVDFSAPFRPWS